MNPDLEEIQITSVDILRFATVLVPMNLFILVTWTLVSPLEWTRVMNDKKDIFERNQESAAVCRSDHYIWFASVLCAVNLGFLFVGTCWAFRTRNLATEYNESRYIGITVVALLQTWSMGIPVLIVVRDYPVADFFVKSGLILLSAGAVLCLVYLPKVLSMRQHSSASTEHNSFFSGGFQFVLKRKRNSASDTEQSNNDIANQTEERPGQGSQVVPSPSQETGSLRPERRQSVKILHNPRVSRALCRTCLTLFDN